MPGATPAARALRLQKITTPRCTGPSTIASTSVRASAGSSVRRASCSGSAGSARANQVDMGGAEGGGTGTDTVYSYSMYVSTRSGPQARPLAVLVHGMGRTPVSMALLALRLRRAGFATALFGYSVTFEKYSACLGRLQRFIDARARPCVLIGHSLGGVLLRSVIPVLARPPAACFLLASPTRACVLARR